MINNPVRGQDLGFFPSCGVFRRESDSKTAYSGRVIPSRYAPSSYFVGRDVMDKRYGVARNELKSYRHSPNPTYGFINPFLSVLRVNDRTQLPEAGSLESLVYEVLEGIRAKLNVVRVSRFRAKNRCIDGASNLTEPLLLAQVIPAVIWGMSIEAVLNPVLIHNS